MPNQFTPAMRIVCPVSSTIRLPSVCQYERAAGESACAGERDRSKSERLNSRGRRGNMSGLSSSQAGQIKDRGPSLLKDDGCSGTIPSSAHYPSAPKLEWYE